MIFEYIQQLLEMQGRHLEVFFLSATDDELVDDLNAFITSTAVRIYGRRNAKRRAAQIQACVKRYME